MKLFLSFQVINVFFMIEKQKRELTFILFFLDKKRVFIMYTRCCEKCSHVVHCFGTVLNSTELIEASIICGVR